MMTDLAQKKCEPCEGKGKALDPEKAKEFLKSTPNWNLDPSAKSISREYVMKNFLTAIKFINSAADIAESENHHPDFHLTGYRKLRIELSTHVLGGLSENDFIVAAKINFLPAELKK